jgi:hypothetical protein
MRRHSVASPRTNKTHQRFANSFAISDFLSIDRLNAEWLVPTDLVLI